MERDEDLIRSLRQQGIRVWAENGRLHVTGPPGSVLAEHLDQLRSRKAEILQLLEGTQITIDDPVRRREPGCVIPLTVRQSGLWRHAVKQGTPLTTRPCINAVRVLGPLNIRHLHRSLEAVVRRHESLRTRFIAVEGIPRQIVDDECEHQPMALDFSEVHSARVEDIGLLAQEFANQPVDLSLGPLFGAKLFQLAQDDHVLVLAWDHIVTDFMSIGIVSREIWDLYKQAGDEPLRLPKPVLQFGDYAVWQERTYADWQRRSEAYWKARFASAPRVGDATDAVRTIAESASSTLQVPFGSTLSNALAALARRERTLLSLVALTLYVALMSRWRNHRDLVVWFVSNGRQRPELEQVTGYLASHLPLRLELMETYSFLDLLKRVELEFRAACCHHDFDRVPRIAPSCFHLPALYFNWLQPSTDTRVDIAGLRIDPFPISRSSPVSFFPYFRHDKTGVRLIVQYQPSVHSPAEMEWLRDNLLRLAESFARCPSTVPSWQLMK